MYELMLDTANLSDIREGIAAWPISGVTTNPSILRKEGDIDVYSRLAEIKKLCGSQRSLHVQTVSTTTREIIEEARFILDRLGCDVYVKIPVSAAGFPAIKTLVSEGVKVTATAIYTTMQGILAGLAGADYIAIYLNRMENNCIDPFVVISEIRSFLDGMNSRSKILAASFRNISQVTSAFASGAKGATVGAEIIRAALGMPSINAAIEAFMEDFEAIHGAGQTMMTITKMKKAAVNSAAFLRLK